MVGEPKLFTEALSLCHIFKYSQDRITNVNELRGNKQPSIEIETLGSAGLRYRFNHKWVEMGAYREVEAELTSFIVCSTLGKTDSLVYARGYIQSYLDDTTVDKVRFPKVYGAADQILKARSA